MVLISVLFDRKPHKLTMATEMTTQINRPHQTHKKNNHLPFTNPYAADFSKPDDQQKSYLAGLGPTIQRKDRKDCLAKMHGEPMPVGGWAVSILILEISSKMPTTIPIDYHDHPQTIDTDTNITEEEETCSNFSN